MKITKQRLEEIIKEEMSLVSEKMPEHQIKKGEQISQAIFGLTEELEALKGGELDDRTVVMMSRRIYSTLFTQLKLMAARLNQQYDGNVVTARDWVQLSKKDF